MPEIARLYYITKENTVESVSYRRDRAMDGRFFGSKREALTVLANRLQAKKAEIDLRLEEIGDELKG